MATEEELIQELRRRGHRITKVRQEMVKILVKHERVHPVSVADMLHALEERSLSVNKTTVYRELEFLIGEKMVREVDLLEGWKRYEVITSGDHHHHLVCTRCSAILCVDMHEDLAALEMEIGKRFNFRIQSHQLEFFGRCDSCGSSESSESKSE